MQRYLLFVASLILFIMFALQGFQPQYQLPTTDQQVSAGPYSESEGPQKALTDIYFNVSIMGVQEATPKKLEAEFGIDPDLYLSLHGKYTDGRFGIADVFILRPRPGKEEEVGEALQTIKLARMKLFEKFDVYNAYQIAENGTIFQRGDYYILLMIDHEESARKIIQSYIPR